MPDGKQVKNSFFISYAHEHEECAMFFKEEIESLYSNTIEVFMASDPECILPSDPWHDRIIKEIQNCTAVFALLSPISTARVWLSFEAGAAIALNKKVFPLRFAELRESDVPSTLRELQSWDLRKYQGIEHILLNLDTDLKPKKENIQCSAKKIAEYFDAIPGDDWTRLYLPPLEVRLRFLGNLSEKQYRLFHMVSRLESKRMLEGSEGPIRGVPRATILETIPLEFNSKVDGQEKKVQISDSEYYYRLRELYFLGLLDMYVINEFENIWSVRKDIKVALFGEGKPRF